LKLDAHARSGLHDVRDRGDRVTKDENREAITLSSSRIATRSSRRWRASS